MAIVFPSSSDAKLASFVLEQQFAHADWQIVAEVFDAVVRIVCEPDFNTKEVQLKTFADIMLVAGNESRRAIVQKVSHTNSSALAVTSGSGSIPPTVLQCVFDYIAEVTVSFGVAIEEEHWTSPEHRWELPSPPLLTRWLSHFPYIPLVHSSWYAASIRSFGRSAAIRGSGGWYRRRRRTVVHDTFKALMSSCHGDWTRHANVEYGTMKEFDINLISYLFMEKMRNLEFLSLNAGSCEGGGNEMKRTLEVVASLPYLKVLCFILVLPDDQMDQFGIYLRNSKIKKLLLDVSDFQPSIHTPSLLNSLNSVSTLEEVQVHSNAGIFGSFSVMRWKREEPAQSTRTHGQAQRRRSTSLDVGEFSLCSLTMSVDEIKLDNPGLAEALSATHSLKLVAGTLELNGRAILQFTNVLQEMHIVDAETNLAKPYEFPRFNLLFLTRVKIEFGMQMFRPEYNTGSFEDAAGKYYAGLEMNVLTVREWLLSDHFPALREIGIWLKVACPINVWDGSERTEYWISVFTCVENTMKELRGTVEERGRSGNLVSLRRIIEWNPIA